MLVCDIPHIEQQYNHGYQSMFCPGKVYQAHHEAAHLHGHKQHHGPGQATPEGDIQVLISVADYFNYLFV